MIMAKRLLRFWMAVLLTAGLASAMSGCPDVARDEASDFDYESRPISIYNPDWGVIPLPNNLLNPVYMDAIGLKIPPSEENFTKGAETMILPVVDEQRVKELDELGFDGDHGFFVRSDSELSKELIAGMNRLDGFIPGFVPRIPFSKKIRMDSIVRANGKNLAKANFFFLDITDPKKPEVVDPATYELVFDGEYRLFNLALEEGHASCVGFEEKPECCQDDDEVSLCRAPQELAPCTLQKADEKPYYLTMRNRGTPPSDYEPGGSYLVVMTGIHKKAAILDLDGNPLQPDSFFLLFASKEPYLAPDGSRRINIIDEEDEEVEYRRISELEAGRQVINSGLEAWEKLVGEKRSRDEVACAFPFTIAMNPMPEFFDAASAVLGSNPLLTKGDKLVYDAETESWELETQESSVCRDHIPSFKFSLPVIRETVEVEGEEDANIRLYRVIETGRYPRIAIDSTLGEDEMTVTITPGQPLSEGRYVVAVRNGILGKEKSRKATDQSYFGLARVSTPLVDERGRWLSPHLDGRIDALMFNRALDDINACTLDEAAHSMLRALKALDLLREEYQGHISFLVRKNESDRDYFVEEREDIVILWTFTIGDC